MREESWERRGKERELKPAADNESRLLTMWLMLRHLGERNRH